MEEIVPLTTSPTEIPLIGVPVGTIGKKIAGFAFDPSGFEIIFEDESRLVIEDWNRGTEGFMECEEANDQHGFFPFVNTWFGGIYHDEVNSYYKDLEVRTSNGNFTVQVYNPETFDIRVVEA